MLYNVALHAKRLAAKGVLKSLATGLQVGHRLPQVAQQQAAMQVCKHALREPLADGDLDCLEGNWLEIHVRDINLSWFFTLRAGQLFVQSRMPADLYTAKTCRIAGPSEDLLRMLGRQQDPDTLFFQRRLELSGDTELGLEIRNVLDAVDLDDLPPHLQTGMHWLTKPLAWQ
ncbi:MAG: SCP2 sterol-binding domain-containing protein [Gammaproteobacteria bacterium]|nr:SCP2 sterol-binding domain-containing protein [Gammaproteobacteria bacterium]